MTWVLVTILIVLTGSIAYTLGRDFRNQRIDDLLEELQDKDILLENLKNELRRINYKYNYVIDTIKRAKDETEKDKTK